MKMADFTESGMAFSFPEESCYKVEDSGTHKSLGTGIKICECIVKHNEKVLFIEAKTSFAKPGNKEGFSEGIQEIVEKFRNSILVYAGILVDRPYMEREELPSELTLVAVRRVPMKCYLLIKNHEKEWLPPVDEALNQALLSVRKTFAIADIKVMNAEMALKYHLIRAITP